MDDTGATSADPFTIIDPVSKVGWIAGVYLQHEWKLTDQLTLNYGFRFDQMWQFVNTNQLSPRVNMIYTPWDGAKIHAGYARYFTPPVQALAGPTNTLAFVNTTNPPGVLQNSPVLPERSHVFDVGATQQFGGFLTGLEMGVDGYYKIARDLIDDGQFGAAYILTAFNYEKGENYGVEWTTKYRNGPFSLYGNLAWAVQRATNIVSNQQLFGPDELAFIANSWVFTDHAQTYTGLRRHGLCLERHPYQRRHDLRQRAAGRRFQPGSCAGLRTDESRPVARDPDAWRKAHHGAVRRAQCVRFRLTLFETALVSGCSRRNLARVVGTSWVCRRGSRRKGKRNAPTAKISSCGADALHPGAAPSLCMRCDFHRRAIRQCTGAAAKYDASWVQRGGARPPGGGG